MDLQLRIVALVASLALMLVVLELVRRRRLLERYALLWLGSACALVLLTAWSGLLQLVADVIGIAYPPSALFVIAFGFVIVLLLHFSVAVSKLADQSKVLAQRLAMLEEKVRTDQAGAALEEAEPDEVPRLPQEVS